jgi:hypothetical protein
MLHQSLFLVPLPDIKDDALFSQCGIYNCKIIPEVKMPRLLSIQLIPESKDVSS